MALESSEQGAGRKVAEELADEPFIEHDGGTVYGVANSPDEQAKIAFILRDACQYSEIQIEATLSRFKQAGGFEAYDKSVLEGVD